MAKKKTIPSRNLSPFGWYVGSYIERLEFFDEDKANLERRCLAWENTVIVKARSREDAYKKIRESGKPARGDHNVMTDRKGRRGKWVFEGLTSLLPIYEQIEDGSEIFWSEHRGKTVRKIKSKAKKKAELEVFQDR